MDWRQRANCQGADPEIFFPVGSQGPTLRQIAEAKSYCHSCEVASECLAWAITTAQDTGVWGGLDEQERRALRRGIRPTVCESPNKPHKHSRKTNHGGRPGRNVSQ